VYLPVHNLIPDDKFDKIVKRVIGVSQRYKEYLAVSEINETTELKKWPENQVLAKL